MCMLGVNKTLLVVHLVSNLPRNQYWNIAQSEMVVDFLVKKIIRFKQVMGVLFFLLVASDGLYFSLHITR